MEHKIRQSKELLNLVSAFEHSQDLGELAYKDEKTFLQLIAYYEQEGNIEKAIEVTELAIDQFIYRSEFFLVKANLLLSEGQIQACEEVLAHLEKIAPFERELTILKAKIAAYNKNFPYAFSLIEEARGCAMPAEEIELYVVESVIFEQMKDYESMYFSLKNALALDPANELILERFWLSVELARKFKDSVAFHQNLIDQNPYNHIAWYNLGLSYSCNWEYDLAIEALEYAYIIEPNFEKAYIDCAELCVQQCKFDKALKIYEEAKVRFGLDGDLVVNMGVCCIKMGNTTKAKSHLLKGLKMDPYNEDIYFHLGECYNIEGQYYSAINAFLKAIDLDDQREEFYLGIANAYVGIEDYPRANINFRKAAEMGVEDSFYWRAHSVFLIKLGLYKEAMKVLDEADEFTFGADLLYCRAAVYFLQKKTKATLSTLEEALEEDFDQRSLFFELVPEAELHKDVLALIRYVEKEYIL